MRLDHITSSSLAFSRDPDRAKRRDGCDEVRSQFERDGSIDESRALGVGVKTKNFQVVTQFPGGHSEREPPDPIPNSEVKTLCADGSVPLGMPE